MAQADACANSREPKWWSRFLNFYFQKNQEELFKPFLISALQKIKEDLEDEFATEIENKYSELQLLKSQNSELTQKLKDVEKKEAKAQKGKAKDTEVKSHESILQEPVVEYPPSKETDNNQLIDLKEKIRDYEKLLRSIDKQTVMKETKRLIADFHKKPNSDELFKNQE